MKKILRYDTRVLHGYVIHTFRKRKLVSLVVFLLREYFPYLYIQPMQFNSLTYILLLSFIYTGLKITVGHPTVSNEKHTVHSVRREKFETKLNVRPDYVSAQP